MTFLQETNDRLGVRAHGFSSVFRFGPVALGGFVSGALTMHALEAYQGGLSDEEFVAILDNVFASVFFGVFIAFFLFFLGIVVRDTFSEDDELEDQ